MNEKLLELVVCPSCQGKLKYEKEKNRLECLSEQLAYPIEQGIPVLLVEQAIALNQEDIK